MIIRATAARENIVEWVSSEEATIIVSMSHTQVRKLYFGPQIMNIFLYSP